MKPQNLISFLLLYFLISCNGQPADIQTTLDYIKSKNEFDNKLVDHFPARDITIPMTMFNYKNEEKHIFGFMLYEYSAGSKTKTSLSSVMKRKAIAHYTNKDENLLIVNRFETIETREKMLDVIISDSTKIERIVYDKLYPIPNFIEYENADSKKDLKLSDSFDIYVLEAKPGNHFKKFNLKPNAQMPKKWENGYSKGVAIGKDKNTIIYWGIIW